MGEGDPSARIIASDRLAAAFAEARTLCEGGQWSTAHQLLRDLDASAVLDGKTLELLGTAAYMVGAEPAFIDAFTRAYTAHSEEGQPLRAARAAFWIGLTLMLRGEYGGGGGWLARSRRLVEDAGGACAERGYLLLPEVERLIATGGLGEGAVQAAEAAEIGRTFGDGDLTAIARHLQGRIHLESGAFEQGVAMLDECMIAVTEGRLSPIVTGLIYCSVIETCQRFQIQNRAREWTDALSGWCGRQPELVAFTGRCLIHRAEILIFDGRWSAAIAETGSACRRLTGGASEHVAGPAHYHEGEVFRLRGDFAAADESYRAANRLGYDPQPGLALMRVAQGRPRVAMSAILRALASQHAPAARMRLLPAAIDIAVGSGRLDDARAFHAELAVIAARPSSEVVAAAAAEATGKLRLAEADPAAALAALAEAAGLWRNLGAPYLLARVRLCAAEACLALGDADGARGEAAAAMEVFEELGAGPDRRRAEMLLRQASLPGGGVLTPRQTEVLQLVADGLTNREIGERLKLSERTIDRHVSDILTRINVPSRAAATAFALSRGLIAARPSG